MDGNGRCKARYKLVALSVMPKDQGERPGYSTRAQTFSVSFCFMLPPLPFRAWIRVRTAMQATITTNHRAV